MSIHTPFFQSHFLPSKPAIVVDSFRFPLPQKEGGMG